MCIVSFTCQALLNARASITLSDGVSLHVHAFSCISQQ